MANHGEKSYHLDLGKFSESEVNAMMLALIKASEKLREVSGEDKSLAEVADELLSIEQHIVGLVEASDLEDGHGFPDYQKPKARDLFRDFGLLPSCKIDSGIKLVELIEATLPKSMATSEQIFDVAFTNWRSMLTHFGARWLLLDPRFGLVVDSNANSEEFAKVCEACSVDPRGIQRIEVKFKYGEIDVIFFSLPMTFRVNFDVAIWRDAFDLPLIEENNVCEP